MGEEAANVERGRKKSPAKAHGGGQKPSGDGRRRRGQDEEDASNEADRTREMVPLGHGSRSPLGDEKLTLRDLKRRRPARGGIQDHRDVAIAFEEENQGSAPRQPKARRPMSVSVISPSEDAFSDE